MSMVISIGIIIIIITTTTNCTTTWPLLVHSTTSASLKLKKRQNTGRSSTTYVTRHTSHITHHTSHISHHTSHITCNTVSGCPSGRTRNHPRPCSSLRQGTIQSHNNMLQAQTPKDTKNQNQKSKTVEKPDTKNSKLQNLDPKSQTPNPKPQTPNLLRIGALHRHAAHVLEVERSLHRCYRAGAHREIRDLGF